MFKAVQVSNGGTPLAALQTVATCSHAQKTADDAMQAKKDEIEFKRLFGEMKSLRKQIEIAEIEQK